MAAKHIEFLMWPGVQTISVMTIAFIYFVGITGFGGVSVTTGMLIAFVGYANNFWNPVINIGNFYNQLVTCSAYLERIFETLDVKPEIANKPGATELPAIQGKVDFNDVVFRYEDDGRNILNLVDFHVTPGKTIALVGPTGAGKTTIVSLLSRFTTCRKVRSTIDGHDVRDVTLESSRRQMGVMLQDTFIFSGNVRDNIRYGKLDATDEEIEAAAKAVHAHEFIMELPDGYDTTVEERGLDPVRRAAPAHRVRACAARRPAHPDSGRGDLEHRHPHRGGVAGRLAASAQGSHELHHRPPAVHHRERGPDLLHRPRPDRGARHARRTAGGQGRVLPPLRVPIRDDSRGHRGY